MARSNARIEPMNKSSTSCLLTPMTSIFTISWPSGKAIETSSAELVGKLEEAERLGEIAHQKYLAEEVTHRKEEACEIPDDPDWPQMIGLPQI